MERKILSLRSAQSDMRFGCDLIALFCWKVATRTIVTTNFVEMNLPASMQRKLPRDNCWRRIFNSLLIARTNNSLIWWSESMKELCWKRSLARSRTCTRSKLLWCLSLLPSCNICCWLYSGTLRLVHYILHALRQFFDVRIYCSDLIRFWDNVNKWVF